MSLGGGDRTEPADLPDVLLVEGVPLNWRRPLLLTEEAETMEGVTLEAEALASDNCL